MANPAPYYTNAGDRWDLISFNVFNNEFFAAQINEANPQYVYTAVFPQGVPINIPPIPQVTSITTQMWGTVSRFS